jgi:hypothetical protein
VEDFFKIRKVEMLFASFTSDLNEAVFALFAVIGCLSYMSYRFAEKHPKAAKTVGKSLIQIALRRYFGL